MKRREPSWLDNGPRYDMSKLGVEKLVRDYVRFGLHSINVEEARESFRVSIRFAWWTWLFPFYRSSTIKLVNAVVDDNLPLDIVYRGAHAE